MDLKKKLLKVFDIEAHKRLIKYSYGYKMQIMIITLISISVAVLSVNGALVTKKIVDSAVNNDPTNAIKFGLLFLLIQMTEMIVGSYISYKTTRVSETIRNTIQINIISKIYKKNWLELNHYQTGDLLTRIYSDVSNVVSVFVLTVPRLIAFMVQLFGAFFILCYYDITLAMLTFLVTPVMVLASMLIGFKLKAIQHKIQRAEAIKQSLITESLQNTLILKSYNYLTYNLSQIKALQMQHFNFVLSRNRVSIKANLIMGAGYRFGLIGAVSLGAYRLLNKAISFGTFTAFLQLVGQIQAPIVGLSQSIPQLIATLSSVERIDEIVALNDDEIEEDDEKHDESRIPIRIDVKDISFEYNHGDTILEDVSLTIHKGEKIAIVGSSGEGKTTLIHILMALMKPLKGSMNMYFDDGSMNPINTRTRKYFSYVPQSNALFSGSIYSNFLLTAPVLNEVIERALIASCSKEFVDELPNGLESILGERGIGLSQGQAQRLTIARALIHGTPFLIFDEATSALDMETEKKLIENLKEYYPETTLIAITHRMSIFEICDQVYHLKDGRLNDTASL